MRPAPVVARATSVSHVDLRDQFVAADFVLSADR
jgi:hypothetical protein